MLQREAVAKGPQEFKGMEDEEKKVGKAYISYQVIELICAGGASFGLQVLEDGLL